MATYDNYTSSWNLYSIWHNDKPGMITLDLGWKNALPVPQLPHLAIVYLFLQDQTENGFISKEESNRIAPVEDGIIEKILASQQCEHIAFFTFDGARQLVFYISNPVAFEPLVDSVMQNVNYEYEVKVAENENWKYYTDCLYPDEYSMQDITTRSIMQQLEKLGDDFSKPREIDYVATFADANEAELFKETIQKEGFENVSVSLSEEDNFYTVEFKKTHEIDRQILRNNIYQAMDILAETKTGGFDGWGCGVVKENEE